MSMFKVILVAMVIFGLGVVTGGLVIQRTHTPAPAPAQQEAPRPTHFGKSDQARRFDFLNCAQKELNLTPEQQVQMELVVSNGQRRMRAIWDEFNPRMQAHYCETREQINEILTPEQQERFQALMQQQWPRKGDGNRAREAHRDGPPDDKGGSPTSP